MRASLIALSLLAAPVSAATWVPAASEMTRIGACGTAGVAQVTGGCTPIVYTGAPGQEPIAASGQDLLGGWNSQDSDAVAWTIDTDGALAVRLMFMDLHDQPASFARVTIGGAEWNFARGANANVRVIDLGMPEGDAIFVVVRTRLNDGFSARADVCMPEA